MTPSKPSAQTEAHPPKNVVEAYEKAVEVTEEVKEAADNLAVAHSVLEHRLPAEPHDEDVKEAVARTNEIQKDLNVAVSKLETVTAKLEDELKGTDAGKP